MKCEINLHQRKIEQSISSSSDEKASVIACAACLYLNFGSNLTGGPAGSLPSPFSQPRAYISHLYLAVGISWPDTVFEPQLTRSDRTPSQQDPADKHIASVCHWSAPATAVLLNLSISRSRPSCRPLGASALATCRLTSVTPHRLPKHPASVDRTLVARAIHLPPPLLNRLLLW